MNTTTTKNEAKKQEKQEEEPKEPWEECDSICYNPKSDESCPFLPCEAILNDWGRLQYILDMIDDINEKVGFLQTLTSRNQHVCYDGRCPIFGKILELRSQIADFDLPITALKTIKEVNLSPQRRNILKQKYNQAKFECDKALQEIMTVATTNRAKDLKEETAHQRRLELIDRLNQSNFPLPIDVKGDIEKVLNTSNDKIQWEKKAGEKKTKKGAKK